MGLDNLAYPQMYNPMMALQNYQQCPQGGIGSYGAFIGQISSVQNVPPVIIRTKFLDRLREEIKEWHGDILERNV